MTSISEMLQTPPTRVNGRQLVFLGLLSNVLVNVVVLNLFVEYADNVIIDSFTISILTAVLLTAMLFAIVRFEHRVREFFFERHEGRPWRISGFFAIWGILFGSKFVILEVVDFVFGSHVELGKLVEVILIVVVMLAAKALTEKTFDALADPPGTPSARTT